MSIRFPFMGHRRPILIDLITKPDEEVRRKFYSIIKHEGDMLIAETENARPRGKPSVLWAKATPLYNPKGEIIGAIESIRDITEFRKPEKPAPDMIPAGVTPEKARKYSGYSFSGFIRPHVWENSEFLVP